MKNIYQWEEETRKKLVAWKIMWQIQFVMKEKNNVWPKCVKVISDNFFFDIKMCDKKVEMTTFLEKKRYKKWVIINKRFKKKKKIVIIFFFMSPKRWKIKLKILHI